MSATVKWLKMLLLKVKLISKGNCGVLNFPKNIEITNPQKIVHCVHTKYNSYDSIKLEQFCKQIYVYGYRYLMAVMKVIRTLIRLGVQI